MPMLLALSVFAACDCRLIGGHSMQGPELQIGFSVNGTALGPAPLRSASAHAGELLLLTRPLGSGALFAAHMQGRADGRDVEGALSLMESGNADAGVTALACGASALTDVTGFGLAGHLLAMLGDRLAADIDSEALPILPGARDAIALGFFSTLHPVNEAAFASRVQAIEGADPALLFDPQTGGGLLMSLPAERAEAALEAVGGRAAGASIIGRLSPPRAASRQIVLH